MDAGRKLKFPNVPRAKRLSRRELNDYAMKDGRLWDCDLQREDGKEESTTRPIAVLFWMSFTWSRECFILGRSDSLDAGGLPRYGLAIGVDRSES